MASRVGFRRPTSVSHLGPRIESIVQRASGLRAAPGILHQHLALAPAPGTGHSAHSTSEIGAAHGTSEISAAPGTSVTLFLTPVGLRRILVYTHRWLGIAGSLLFVAWFASGVVMMYARMPRLSPEERLMRAPILDLRTARVDPAEAARRLARSAERLRVGMLGDRPVYRFYDGARWTTVFADTGEILTAFTEMAAAAIARRFAPEHAATIRHTARVEAPDQWTLQIRALLPAHKLALGDRHETYLYITEQTGEPVLQTTRAARIWGYAGAVVHWIYFTPVRRNSAAWVALITWTSIAGSFLCLTGIVWGLWRYSTTSRYRLRGVPHTHSPYAGMMRWHHYAGLIFGVITFTWVFSGLLSMNPWDWSPSTSPTRAQRDAVAGGPFRLKSLTLGQLRTAVNVLGEGFPVKEIELLKFRGEMVAEAYRAPDAAQPLGHALGDPGAVLATRLPLEHRLASLTAPERGSFTQFDRHAVETAARDAMPGVPVQDATWLSEYDSYYYDRERCVGHACGAPPLPVLRVRFADSVGTWLYLDPERGTIIRKEERLTRINRWLYHGLHSLDFPWLYDRRPLWDAVVIVLSVGGLVVSLSSAPQAWRRLRRHARRVRATMRGWLSINR